MADVHRALVEGIRDRAIFALDASGTILTWNLGAEQMSGFPADEAVGRELAVLYAPRARQAGEPSHDLHVATTSGGAERVGWWIRRDGSRFRAPARFTPLPKGAEPARLAVVMEDLASESHAESALRASDERFRLFIQSVKDYGLFMLDPAGHIVSWNEGAQRIKGYAAEEILGRHFSTFYPPEASRGTSPRTSWRSPGGRGGSRTRGGGSGATARDSGPTW